VISIIVPTLNEAKSIAVLAQEIAVALRREDYELIVVDDDSPDLTWEIAGGLRERCRVKVLRRVGKTGLASAVVDGFKAARGDIIGVMDADLSHPPAALPALLAAIRQGGADLAIASRLVPGGGTEGWPRTRKLTSRIATLLARPLTRVRDPLSGCFFFRREVIAGVALKPRGYKIGLEILVKGNARSIVEVPIIFRDRTVGMSKLSMKQNLEYLVQLADLLLFKLGRRP
jgi:dolichol-phosphate mannosyltransferase